MLPAVDALGVQQRLARAAFHEKMIVLMQLH
jgi:hypothetical protein